MTDTTRPIAPASGCCSEAGCRRAKPFIFTRIPETGRWIVVTRWKELEGVEGDRQIEVLERHDVTDQIETILLQYRAWLDAHLMKAATEISSAAKLTIVEHGRKS